MAADEIMVVATVGPPNGEPSIRVMRAQTVTIGAVGDLEGYAIEALRLVDEMVAEVREDAIRQVRALMDRVKKEAAEHAEGVRR